MKTFLFVNANTSRRPYPVPPVGICLAAAALEGRCHTPIYDGGADEARLAEAIRAANPDFVGLGIRNVDDAVMDGGVCFLDEARDRFARVIRAATRAPLILGGSGFSLFPDELLRFLDADYGIVGESELALLSLVECLDRGGDASGIPGVACRGRPWNAAAARPSVSLAALPFAEVDRRMDYAAYRQRGAYPIQTKRGCDRECVYCTYPLLEGRWPRVRPPAAVADELEQALGRLGSVTFEIVDSTFNAPCEHAVAVCREIAGRGLRPALRTMGINPAHVRPELLGAMRDAGFTQVDVTPDSASPSMLTNLGKGFGVGQLQRTADLLRAHGLPAMWFFLAGGPGESEATLGETLDFVDRHVAPEDMVLISSGLRIYPGTRLHERAVAERVVSPGESLLRPRFYVEPRLGRDRLAEWIRREAATRPNCVPASESAPDEAMLAEALRRRREQGLAEPMFRTLLRIRREEMRG